MTENNVPRELAQIGQRLLAEGWVLSGATYTHPNGPGVATLSYCHREATLKVFKRALEPVSQWGSRVRTRSKLVYVTGYRGEHPLAWAENFLLGKLADNPDVR